MSDGGDFDSEYDDGDWFYDYDTDMFFSDEEDPTGGEEGAGNRRGREKEVSARKRSPFMTSPRTKIYDGHEDLVVVL